jgi:hypothetical protein
MKCIERLGFFFFFFLNELKKPSSLLKKHIPKDYKDQKAKYKIQSIEGNYNARR